MDNLSAPGAPSLTSLAMEAIMKHDIPIPSLSFLPSNLLEDINNLRNVVGFYRMNSFYLRVSDPLGVLPQVDFQPSFAVLPVFKPSPGSWMFGGDMDFTLTLGRQEDQPEVVWIEGSSIKVFARDEEMKVYMEFKVGVSGEISHDMEFMCERCRKRFNYYYKWVKI